MMAFCQSEYRSIHFGLTPSGRSAFSNVLRFSGAATANSTIAESFSRRPGAMSVSSATSRRASQSDLMIASSFRVLILCIPDVRRHGSLRGSGAGAARMLANSSSAHSNFPASASLLAIISRSSTRSSTSSAAYVSHSWASGRIDQSTALCSFASE